MGVALVCAEREGPHLAIVGIAYVMDGQVDRLCVFGLDLHSFSPADHHGPGLVIHNSERGLVIHGVVIHGLAITAEGGPVGIAWPIIVVCPVLVDIPLKPPPRNVRSCEGALIQTELFREDHVDLIADILPLFKGEFNKQVDTSLGPDLITEQHLHRRAEGDLHEVRRPRERIVVECDGGHLPIWHHEDGPVLWYAMTVPSRDRHPFCPWLCGLIPNLKVGKIGVIDLSASIP
mmetsp:Transcript_130398/g.225449  ORF Transcript_130398/g.225449 Transcript_130398/m.225449 type:complete len:233 (+) Transcript_130398:437-1135(+)